jgi:hypothetical protein
MEGREGGREGGRECGAPWIEDVDEVLLHVNDLYLGREGRTSSARILHRRKIRLAVGMVSRR